MNELSDIDFKVDNHMCTFSVSLKQAKLFREIKATHIVDSFLIKEEEDKLYVYFADQWQEIADEIADEYTKNVVIERILLEDKF
jgi:hypothetical protein